MRPIVTARRGTSSGPHLLRACGPQLAATAAGVAADALTEGRPRGLRGAQGLEAAPRALAGLQSCAARLGTYTYTAGRMGGACAGLRMRAHVCRRRREGGGVLCRLGKGRPRTLKYVRPTCLGLPF